MPTHSPEYESARQHAVLFDLSSRSKVELSGPEALIFLHNLCTQDVKNLPMGAGCEAFLTNAKARIIAPIFVGRYEYAGRDVIWVDSDAGLNDKLLQHLNHYLISEQVELADRTREFGMLHICGPHSRTTLDQVVNEPLPELPPLHHVSRSIVGHTCFIRRRVPLGLSGYDVLCETGKLTQVRDALLSAGATAAGDEVYEILRVEAGTPVFGKDIDEDRFVVEVGRTKQAISYTKGCFLGQEPIVMARDRGHVNRLLVGVKIEGGEAIKPGTRLFRDGTEVGQVTSSALSPALGQPIALAYLRRGSWDAGTRLQIDPPADGRQAVVAALPMVPSE
jgi:folate-binding protein YgfZ